MPSSHTTITAYLEPLTKAFFLLALFFLPISKAMVEIGAMGTIIGWLILKTRNKEDFFIEKKVLFPYSFLLAWMILSFVNMDSENLYKGVRGFLKWIEYLGFLVIVAEILNNKKVQQKCLWIFFASMLLVTINGFYQLWHGTDFLRHVSLDPGRITRMKSSLGAANNLASFYLLALPLAFYHFKINLDQKNKLFYFYLALFISFFAAFILTFSRAAFLGLVLSTTFYLALKNRRLLIIFFAGLLILLGVSATLRSNFVTSINFNDITIQERLHQWQASWELFKTHPFLGHGVNMFYQKLPPLKLESGLYRGYAHNSYLQMLVEAGSVGLFVFILPLLAGLGKFCRDKKSTLNDALWVGLSAFLIQAFFDNNFYAMQPAFLFWLFLGFYFRRGPMDLEITSKK